MDLLIDTNIFLDTVFDRNGTDETRQLFQRMEEKGDRAFLTASSATDLFYIMHRNFHDLNKTYEALGKILRFANVLLVDEDDIRMAFYARWRDFEDCVQFMTAKHNRMDYIVTRNKQDFEDESVPAISPDEYLMM